MGRTQRHTRALARKEAKIPTFRYLRFYSYQLSLEKNFNLITMKKILLVYLLAISFLSYSQEADTLSIEIEESIQTVAYDEFKTLADSLSSLKQSMTSTLVELESLRQDIESGNTDRATANSKIDEQINKLKGLQHNSYNNLKNVLSRMISASDVTDQLASTWVTGITLSQTISNPFSNSVVRSKWDKFANTAKWIPTILLTGYSFASDQSTDNKLGSMAIGVSVTGLVDIVQNLSKKDGVNTTTKVLEQGGVAIEVISMYRAGYDDLKEIVDYLNNYQSFMVTEAEDFKKWYKKLDDNQALTMNESQIVQSEFWIDSTFTIAQKHLENTQKRIEYYYNIFNRVDLLITSKMSNTIFSRYAKATSQPNSLEFEDEAPKMLTELYDNLSLLRSSLNSNKKQWESLRKRYYTLRPSELDAITSWIDLKAEMARLELLKI